MESQAFKAIGRSGEEREEEKIGDAEGETDRLTEGRDEQQQQQEAKKVAE